ncbi:hypothetical protein GCM10010532_058650 [Dactylosporangium siamense]|uniref:LamG-like jellyroll fold domain-containing protein n=1 Tax=Dactylosporangium siamense TaxID=685454 RepID=A0A919UC26_9ACTN|nr:hypothetical protein Dsi01nite_042360 [Dactylosporangium siamense]
MVLLLAALALIVPVGANAAFTAATQNTGSTLGSAATFPTYPAAVTGDTPWAYWRGEDTTTTAADSSGSAHPGTYQGPVQGASTWWPADENAGTVAEDLSGSANRATLGAAAGWATGRDGVHSAMSFSGNAATSYAAGGLPAVRTDQSFTVMAWVYPHAFTQHRAVLSQPGTITSGFILKYEHSVAKWRVIMSRTDTVNPTSDSATSTTAAALDTWVHLAVVFTVGGPLQLYVNGVLENTGSHTTLFDATGALQVGRSQWNSGWTDAFDGRIDEVRTYRRALNAGQVAAVYGNGETTHWNLDEGTGTTTADAGTTSNPGTLGTGASWTTGPTGHGNAVALDGTANGYVSSTAPGVRTDTAVSFSAWAKASAATANTGVVSISGTNAVGATLGINAAGRWTFALTQTDTVGPAVDAASATAAVSTGVWVHLVGVYDGLSAMKLYVDNVLAGSATHTTRWNAAGGLQAGRLRTTTGAYGGAFSGAVDDVRLYARALNASDIAQLFANGTVDPGPGVVPNPISVGLPGALQGTQQGQSAATATGFRGVTNLSSNTTVSNPGPFTVEAWIRTWAGGAVIGFGTTQTGYSGTRDRMLFVDSGNRLSFAVYPGSSVAVRSPAGTSYADGAWHHVAASVGADGIKLYADGALVASNAAVTAAESSTGYWRVGGISLAGWTNRPANDYFVGVIDEPAVYAAQLTDQQVAWHFHANH